MAAKKLFIVLDGLDGSGKGEMVKYLQEYFSHKQGFDILVTFEPTNGRYGKEIRQLLASDKDPKANAEQCLELFVKDREEHILHLIKPFLDESDKGDSSKKGDKADNNIEDNSNTRVVICDRYYYSTIAFQHTQGLDLKLLLKKNSGFLKPDLAFILDLPVEVALKRMEDRGNPVEKFEKLEFMKKLRDNFLNLRKLIPKDNIVMIDASGTKEEVFEQIKKSVDELLAKA